DASSPAPVGLVALLSIANAAGTATTSTLPNEPVATASYYKKSVYDPNDAKIGEINDVLVDTTGKVTGLVVGVGVFLGVGKKAVIVPFQAIRKTKRNGQWRFMLNVTKDGLRKVPGFKYDTANTTWVPEKSP